MTLVTGTIKDVAGVPDLSPWTFTSVMRASSATAGVTITSKSVQVKPASGGVLSVDIDPGFCVVSYKNVDYNVTVPVAASVDIWTLIQAVTAVPGVPAYAPTTIGVNLFQAPNTASARSTIGLNLVDNTADSTKAVLSATKLATARTINGVSFDGTANITVADSTKEATANKGAASGYCGLDGTSKVAIGNLPLGSSASTVCVGNDARLSDARTPTAAGQAYDLSEICFGRTTTRTTGLGDHQFGIKLQRAVTFTNVTYRVYTPDASGNLVVELRKNGTTVAGSSATIAAASQVTPGGSASGTWSFAAGDFLTVYITGVGTTPGAGLIADIKGTTA
jgi:hypothetical protein